MTARSRQSTKLAYVLGEHFGVRVEVAYDGPPSHGGRYGGWIVSWPDGPTTDTMRAEITRRAPRYPAVDTTILRFHRGRTDQGEAAAVVAWLAEHPDRVDELGHNSFLRETAVDETDFPERLDEAVQRRARALLSLDRGGVSPAALAQLGDRVRRGGWEQAMDWLDQLAAVAEGTAGDNIIPVTRRTR
ncbi:hypothetical protein BAY61_32125 (plasmid) [Prauserella marina]|uniref:Uncharacterized protein n=1 Tax=Prauserella marina TaxID=530584 RepID=A0A222W1K1_9PSEU|nr:hypothetical protein [Prauserella marina]ASR39932.1 hypothetical protein BAY61_32125 [Prauserella marina]PWV71434.1 hypothetical protein DES30_112150 [Prauserella marina]SDD97724.1 hypothetical protein SAMN05421630_115129 [Prauserella marina]